MLTAKSWKKLGDGAHTDLPIISVSVADQRRNSEFPKIGELKLQQKRPSVMKINSSPNMLLPGIERRVSNPFTDNANGIRRPSFRKPSLATVGRRVSTILGMRRMRANPEERDENPLSKIKELPKRARFSTTFSDEAQFAMLKGYEDVLINELSKNYPQHKALLLRNTTPKVPVIVKRCPDNETSGSGEQTASQSDVDNDNDTSSEVAAKPEDDPGEIWDTDDVFSKPIPVRRVSCRIAAGTHQPKPSSGDMKRARSLPVIGKKNESRLIITHRFQNAIDILESLRKTLGQTTISPRVRRDKVFPLRDFNFWTSAWFSEFTPKQ